LELPLTGFVMEADSLIPYGAGLGASASLAAASVLSLNKLFNLKLSSEKIIDVVNRSESVFHLNPSGIDTIAVLKPGYMLFNKKNGVTDLDSTLLKIAVFDSGTHGSTAEMVKIFSKKLSNIYGKDRFDRICNIVSSGKEAVKKGDTSMLGELMNENQNLLKWFGVSTLTLDNMCKIANRHRSAGAKLTGGGGGGCIIVLQSEKTDIKSMELEMEQSGYNRIM